jgi:hypothetical protein
MKKTNEQSAGGKANEPWITEYEQAEVAKDTAEEVERERQKKAKAAGNKRRLANAAKKKRLQSELADATSVR